MGASAFGSGRRPDLSIRLLGRIEVESDAGPVRLAGRQAQALLALLVLERRPRTRDAIAADLWPEADATSSASLRQALWLVRSGLGAAGVEVDRVIEVDGDVLGLRPEALIETDAARFEAAVRGSPSRPAEAISLYRGDLAEGLGHECFAAERERLADAYEDALALVAERRLASGNFEGARATAARLLARDPLREEGHAVLMRVFGAVGSRSQVYRQYRRLCDVLDRELAVEPLPETKAAYRIALSEAAERSAHHLATAVFAPARARFAGPA